MLSEINTYQFYSCDIIGITYAATLQFHMHIPSIFKSHKILAYIKYSFAAAILYCGAVYIFIRSEAFSEAYVLYIGNMLFACAIITFILLYNRKRKQNAPIGVMVFAGHITTVIGIILACIICLFLLFVFAPDTFNILSGHTYVLSKTPPQMTDKARGSLLILFMNAIFGNISVGSFFSIILPYAAKRNQKGDTATVKKK